MQTYIYQDFPAAFNQKDAGEYLACDVVDIPIVMS